MPKNDVLVGDAERLVRATGRGHIELRTLAPSQRKGLVNATAGPLAARGDAR